MALNRRSVLKSIGAATGLGVVGVGAAGQVTAATPCGLTAVPGETDGLAALADGPAARQDVIETYTADIVASYADRGVLPATDPYSVFDYETYDPTRGLTDLNDGFQGVSATGYVESEGGGPVPEGRETTVVRASTVVDGTYVGLGVVPAANGAIGIRHPAATAEAGSRVGADHVSGAEAVKVELSGDYDPDRIEELFDDLNTNGKHRPYPVKVPWPMSAVGSGNTGDEDDKIDIHLSSVEGSGVIETAVRSDVEFTNDDTVCFPG